MEEKVLALTYDNKIVRIPREKLEEFKENQAKKAAGRSGFLKVVHNGPLLESSRR